MGFLDFIFGKKIKWQDEFFGEMLFLENRRHPERNYFACRRQFAPTATGIDISVDGDLTGSLGRQQDFFKKIEEEYNSFASKLAPMVEQEVRNWRPDFQVLDFKKEFEPVHISLPRCDSQPVVWEIAFTTFHDEDHHFNFTMHDFEPVELLIDG